MSTAHKKKHTTSKKVTTKSNVILEPKNETEVPSPLTSDALQPIGIQPMQAESNVASVPEAPLSSEKIVKVEQNQSVTTVEDAVPTAPAVQPVAFEMPETEPTTLSAPIVGAPVSAAPVVSAPASSDPLAGFKEKLQQDSSSSIPAKKNFMWPILFIFVIALAILGGVFIYKQGIIKTEKVNEVVLTPAPIRTVSPTIAKVDLSKYEVKILNGSETEGEAGRQKISLEEEGFTISAIGNATESDYTDTIIQAKKEVESAFLDELKKVLELSFSVGKQEELPDDADSDVVVIIGSKKAN